MMFAQIIDNAVTRYPVTGTDIKREHPGISFPSGVLSAEIMAQFSCLPVQPTQPPEYDLATHKAVEGTPVLQGDAWVQTWTIEPLTEAEKQARVPQVVSRFQAKAALAGAGLLDMVETMMSNPETPIVARLAWQDALEFGRDSPTILTMAASLELTPAQIDDLFISAAQITA